MKFGKTIFNSSNNTRSYARFLFPKQIKTETFSQILFVVGNFCCYRETYRLVEAYLRRKPDIIQNREEVDRASKNKH